MNEMNFSGASVKCDEMSFPNYDTTPLNDNLGNALEFPGGMVMPFSRYNSSHHDLKVVLTCQFFTDATATTQDLLIFLFTPDGNSELVGLINEDLVMLASISLKSEIISFTVPPCCSYFLTSRFDGNMANAPICGLLECGDKFNQFAIGYPSP